jgi:TatD DNase family protein
MNNNMYVSVGGPITFKNARKLVDVVKFIPLDRLLVETDCPYLAPEPFRGKRNDSSLLKFIIEKIAEIRGVSIEKAIELTTENARTLFGIK